MTTISRKIRILPPPTPHSSNDTIHVLTELLAEAHDGQLIGAVIIAMYGQRKYRFELTGEAERSATYTLGMIGALHAHVSRGLTPPG